jgi:adenylosuccinate synthase
MMMKADVLSGLNELKVCTEYKYGGETIKHIPFSLNDDLVTPVYTELKPWSEDLTKMNSADQLPNQLKSYTKFIEEYIGVPIVLISVGPDREQTLWRG